MRVTIDKNDPDCIGPRDQGRYTVLLNGEVVNGATEADDNKGYVDVLMRDERGHLCPDPVDPNAFRKYRATGRVQIVDGMRYEDMNGEALVGALFCRHAVHCEPVER